MVFILGGHSVILLGMLLRRGSDRRCVAPAEWGSRDQVIRPQAEGPKGRTGGRMAWLRGCLHPGPGSRRAGPGQRPGGGADEF